MVADLSEIEFGPQIGIREYSFLENPLLENKVCIVFYKCYQCRNFKFRSRGSRYYVRSSGTPFFVNFID